MYIPYFNWHAEPYDKVAAVPNTPSVLVNRDSPESHLTNSNHLF